MGTSFLRLEKLAKRHKTICGLGLLALFITAAAVAAPFETWISFTQPDGTEIELWGQGDEFHAVFETLDGFSVVFDQASKAYHYAQLSADGEELISTGLEVGKVAPAAPGLPKHLRIKPEAIKKRALARYQRWDQGMQISTRWNALKTAQRQSGISGQEGPVMGPLGFTTTGPRSGSVC